MNESSKQPGRRITITEVRKLDDGPGDRESFAVFVAAADAYPAEVVLAEHKNLPRYGAMHRTKRGLVVSEITASRMRLEGSTPGKTVWNVTVDYSPAAGGRIR